MHLKYHPQFFYYDFHLGFLAEGILKNVLLQLGAATGVVDCDDDVSAGGDGEGFLDEVVEEGLVIVRVTPVGPNFCDAVGEDVEHVLEMVVERLTVIPAFIGDI